MIKNAEKVRELTDNLIKELKKQEEDEMILNCMGAIAHLSQTILRINLHALIKRRKNETT